MAEVSHTIVTEFILLGFTKDPHTQAILFCGVPGAECGGEPKHELHDYS